MSCKDARKIVMAATSAAMRAFDAEHRGEEIDLNARLQWINGYVAASVPPEVRKLAV